VYGGKVKINEGNVGLYSKSGALVARKHYSRINHYGGHPMIETLNTWARDGFWQFALMAEGGKLEAKSIHPDMLYAAIAQVHQSDFVWLDPLHKRQRAGYREPWHTAENVNDSYNAVVNWVASSPHLLDVEKPTAPPESWPDLTFSNIFPPPQPRLLGALPLEWLYLRSFVREGFPTPGASWYQHMAALRAYLMGYSVEVIGKVLALDDTEVRDVLSEAVSTFLRMPEVIIMIAQPDSSTFPWPFAGSIEETLRRGVECRENMFTSYETICEAARSPAVHKWMAEHGGVSGWSGETERLINYNRRGGDVKPVRKNGRHLPLRHDSPLYDEYVLHPDYCALNDLEWVRYHVNSRKVRYSGGTVSVEDLCGRRLR